MDPSRIFFLNEYYLIENLSVRLVEMDAIHGYKLMLASSIEQKSDTEYEVKIRKTSFSNGELVSLEDVKASLLRAKSSTGSHVPLAEILDSVSVKEDVLRIRLKKRINDFLYFLTLADLSILHKSQIEKKELLVEDWERVSSGPFIYLVQGQEVFLVKNKHFQLAEVNYPEKIRLLSARGRDTLEDFKAHRTDIGEFNLNSYEKHIDHLDEVSDLHVIGNSGDMINFFALNADHSKFKSEYNRRWLQKKIMLNYELDPKYKNIARKALQFFTPHVKGFLDESRVLNEVKTWKGINTEIVPDELKEGITISTYQRVFEVSLRGAFDQLEKILGVPVKIEASVPSVEFESFIKKRDFEIFLGVTAMDQVIVGESINLYYFSSSPMFKDVHGSIKKLMIEYQHADPSETVGVVNSLALQMIKDSECVPVFYVASPFFYNKSKFDVSSLDEMTYFNLWKITIKK